LTEFSGKALQSVTKGDLDLGEVAAKEGKKNDNKTGKEYQDLLSQIKEVLKDKVQDVRITRRLTTSPACLVAGEHDMGRHLEQILKATGQNISGSKPILEINPAHPIVLRLKNEKDENKISDWSHILFDQSLLSEGGQLEDPAGFVGRLNSMFLEMTGSEDVKREA
jgi:molecular chaperone HtpG